MWKLGVNTLIALKPLSVWYSIRSVDSAVSTVADSKVSLLHNLNSPFIQLRRLRFQVCGDCKV